VLTEGKKRRLGTIGLLAKLKRGGASEGVGHEKWTPRKKLEKRVKSETCHMTCLKLTGRVIGTLH